MTFFDELKRRNVRRVAEAVRSQNWSTVGIELLVVVLGIFIGLQVDDWNEARKDVARERYYLERIQAELRLDIAGYADAVDSAIKRRGMGRLLLEAIAALERMRRRPRAIELIPRATAHDWAQVSMEQLMTRAESLHESIAQHLR